MVGAERMLQKMLQIWVIQLHIISRACNIDCALDGSEIEVEKNFAFYKTASISNARMLWSSKHAKLCVIADFAGSCPQIALRLINYGMLNFPQDIYFYELVQCENGSYLCR